MIRKTITAALVMVLGLVAACATDVAGNWTVNMTGPMGPETLDLALEADGGNLAITGKHSVLGDAEGTGTLDGDAITMNVATTGDMKVGFVLTGTVDGDEMSGTREIKMPEGGGGAPPQGGPADGAPEGAPAGGAPAGGAPEGAPEGGAPGGAEMGELPDEWTAVRN